MMNDMMRRAPRAGFTLIELLIAITVFSIVMGGALGFMRSQQEGFDKGTDRMDLLQNARYAINQLHQDVRVMGSNTPDDQPALVYAGADVVAFNGDFATNVAGDPFAVYYDPDAPSGHVSAMTSTDATAILGTGWVWPSTSYLQGVLNSPAELITFAFSLDSSTARTDDYVLWRRINGRGPELIARSLLRTSGGPFFEYIAVRTVVGQPTRLRTVAQAELPMRHTQAFHLSAADTGAAARVDSIRAVRIRFTATNGETGAEERTRAIERLIRMPNAGLAIRNTCGDEPILGTALTRTLTTDANGDPIVRLQWGQSTDEAGGENDVIRYVIWRRPTGQPDWGDPYLSIPAGSGAYLYDDAAVEPGASYQYALAAQDCTPSLSSLSTVASVTIP